MTSIDKNSREFMLDTLNGQTAKVRWVELERHFAKGSVITVDGSLDLVEVATQFATDDVATVKQLTDQRLVSRTTTLEAQDWLARDPVLWAVVAAPWVLVQERKIEPAQLN